MPTLNGARVALLEAPRVVPDHPKMVPLVAALEQVIESRGIPARGPE